MTYFLLFILLIFLLILTDVRIIRIWNDEGVNDMKKENGKIKYTDYTGRRVYGYEIYNTADAENLVLTEIEKVMGEWGFDLLAVLAISALETGYWRAPTARVRIIEKNNIMGIDEPDGTGKAFYSITDCLIYFRNLIQYSRYYKNTAYPVRGKGEQFITALSQSGYNTTKQWLNGVLSIYRQYKRKYRTG